MRTPIPFALSVIVLCLLTNTLCAPAHSAQPGSFAEMLDFRSICKLKTWRTFQASGYDRGGGFYDSGNFIRIENGNRFVLMEANGPGCINRMWFTYKSESGGEPYDLVIHLDDKSRPAIDMDLDELFSSKRSPFVAPLAGMCGNTKHPGRYSYVPIGFERYCKVVLVPTGKKEQYQHRVNSFGNQIPHIYYQITYRKFEPETAVKRFSWELSDSESKALKKLQHLWSNCGRTPFGYVEDGDAGVKAILKPGDHKCFFDLEGPGVIYAIRLNTGDVGGLWLEMAWDGSQVPQVSAPAGPFFGFTDSGRPEQDVRGLWTGAMYCYLPMPFRRNAKISVRSDAPKERGVELTILYQTEEVSEDDCLFHAHRYDYASPETGKNYCVADIKGAGHFIGLVMDRPGHMEGDDTFFVDGENTPSIHGTGTEDYFNFAWGLSHTGTLALHGITIQNGSPICYRMDTPWGVPFADSLLINWEHGHDSEKGPNLDNRRYSGVAFYYAARNN